MKVGIFIDNFFTTQTYKDPGVIAESLFKLGHEVTIYCFNTDLKNFNTLIVKQISQTASRNSDFWKKETIDSLILYSWLSLRFSALIKALKQAEKKIILKLDTDGHLIYPLKPTYLRTFGRDNSPKQLLIHLARLVQWSLFFKSISRRRLTQLTLCDAAIVESPLALTNLKNSLSIWHREEILKKLNFIPNPINSDIINSVTNKPTNFPKENIIICIGRWDDKQKNRTGLIKSLNKTNLENWRLVIIGSGASRVKSQLKSTQPQLSVEAIESLPHHSINEQLSKAKIFLAPSNHESFNLAAAEALCSGCSLAGTPLESFAYFSDQGRYGTLAVNFQATKISRALATEIGRWNRQEYNPQNTANYWREQLSPETIGQKIAALLLNL